MSRVARRRPRVIVQVREQTAQVAGPVRLVHPVLRDLACPWRYESRLHGYVVPVQQLPAVVTCLRARGLAVVEVAR